MLRSGTCCEQSSLVRKTYSWLQGHLWALSINSGFQAQNQTKRPCLCCQDFKDICSWREGEGEGASSQQATHNITSRTQCTKPRYATLPVQSASTPCTHPELLQKGSLEKKEEEKNPSLEDGNPVKDCSNMFPDWKPPEKKQQRY